MHDVIHLQPKSQGFFFFNRKLDWPSLDLIRTLTRLFIYKCMKFKFDGLSWQVRIVFVIHVLKDVFQLLPCSQSRVEWNGLEDTIGAR